MTLSINMEEAFQKDALGRKNFAYATNLKVYYELELDDFFKNKVMPKLFKFNTNSICVLGEKCAYKVRAEREEVVKKALTLVVADPKKYT